MTQVIVGGSAAGAEEQAAGYQSQGYIARAWRSLRRQPSALVALAVLAVICLLTIFSPWIDANLLHQDPNIGILTQRFQPPSAQHILGTDDFGRDQLARLLVAGQVSLTIGFMIAVIALTIGIALGLLAGFYGGIVDDIINAATQVVLNIPLFFLLILLAAIYRPNVLGLSLIFGITGWP